MHMIRDYIAKEPWIRNWIAFKIFGMGTKTGTLIKKQIKLMSRGGGEVHSYRWITDLKAVVQCIYYFCKLGLVGHFYHVLTLCRPTVLLSPITLKPYK